MRKILTIGVLLAIGLPIYGQQGSSQSGGDIKEEPSSGQCNYATANPQSYFSRLRAPENLPNLLLVIVGFGGIIVAGITLGTIKTQARHMGEQTGILKQSADIGRGAAVPTLRMHKFNMSGSDPLVDNEMELTVRNYGATPAILDALYISFDDAERWPTAEGTPVAYDDRGGQAVAANSDGTLHCSPTICLVSPRQIESFRTDMQHLYVHGRLKYLDVFESPVRNLRFDVCLRPRQNGTIHCEIIGQRNEYDNPQNPN
jgi:hypothetical protein